MISYLTVVAATGETFWEKIAAWYQNSLLYELISHIRARYFSVELGTYENFSVSDGTAAMLQNMILAIVAGLLIAAAYTAYVRNVPGGFVRKLLAEQAHSPEKSFTLMELGYFRSPMIRYELSKGTSLRMVVRSYDPTKEAVKDTFDTAEIGEKNTDVVQNTSKKSVWKQERPDFLTARFYIPEELKYRADVRFDKTGSGWGPLIIAVVVSIFVAAAICWFLPDILALADNIISLAAPD